MQSPRTSLTNRWGVFRSSWAKNIQQELQKAAEMAASNHPVDNQQEVLGANNFEPDRQDLWESVTPDSWEDRVGQPANWKDRARQPVSQNRQRVKHSPKIRTPVIVQSWFGIDSSSSDESEEDNSSWTNVERGEQE